MPETTSTNTYWSTSARHRSTVWGLNSDLRVKQGQNHSTGGTRHHRSAP